MTAFPVRDAMGRERQMTIELSDDGYDIAVLAPPGELSLVDPGQLPEIVEELLRLQTLAYARRTGRRTS
jgi:hypothetical protein